MLIFCIFGPHSPTLIYTHLDLIPNIQPIFMPISTETPYPALVYADLTLGPLSPALIYAHLGLISHYPDPIYAYLGPKPLHPALMYAHIGLKALDSALMNANLALGPQGPHTHPSA